MKEYKGCRIKINKKKDYGFYVFVKSELVGRGIGFNSYNDAMAAAKRYAEWQRVEKI